MLCEPTGLTIQPRTTVRSPTAMTPMMYARAERGSDWKGVKSLEF